VAEKARLATDREQLDLLLKLDNKDCLAVAEALENPMKGFNK